MFRDPVLVHCGSFLVHKASKRYSQEVGVKLIVHLVSLGFKADSNGLTLSDSWRFGLFISVASSELIAPRPLPNGPGVPSEG